MERSKKNIVDCSIYYRLLLYTVLSLSSPLAVVCVALSLAIQAVCCAGGGEYRESVPGGERRDICRGEKLPDEAAGKAR